MSESKTSIPSRSRKPVTQDYYTDTDYDEIMEKLPDIIKAAVRKAGEVIEPTVHEKHEVMNIIKDFIRQKGRKVYGGTAMNENIKAVNPADAIYDEYKFSDIEFYSPTPIHDLIELCNILYHKKFKYVIGREAQHEETYSIFVNFQLYCDISYVPTRVYHGIRTIEIDGIHYTHPHFILIDQLRIINQPLTAAEHRWEKTFKRMYLLLKNYPLEYFEKKLVLPKPNDEIRSYISKIKSDFMNMREIQEICLISGFEAYNFYIRHALGDRTVEQMARTVASSKMDNYLVNVPYFELVSVSYHDTVEKMYKFLRKIVIDPKKLSLEEYFPLFQFTSYSVFINYNGQPIVRIFDADGFCVPDIKTTRGYYYVSYQYLLMTMLISKFRAHLDKDREMYFNYGIAVSNLVNARNIFLSKNNLGVINNTVFSEFRIACIGSTTSYMRESQLRRIERNKRGKVLYSYSPEQFFSKSQEEQERTDPLKKKYSFKNTSGNKILNPKNLMFRLDSEGNIYSNTLSEEAVEEQPSSPEEKSDTTDGNSQ